MKPKSVYLMAGFAQHNASLYRRIGQPLGDPAAWIEIDGRPVAMVRDLEMDRVRVGGRVDQVICPAQHPTAAGLSADRETATAQALAQFLKNHDVEVVTVDRTLPQIYAWHLSQAGINIRFDPDMAVVDRRSKSPDEIEALTAAQRITETVMRLLCEKIAAADVQDDGSLVDRDGNPLTSESIRYQAAIEFLQRDCTMSHGAIIATAPQVADCHHAGSGPLRTGVPIIVDLFPRHEPTRYWGDCTRTVVHGKATPIVMAMHAAVVQAKQAATQRLRTGVTADEVHKASEDSLIASGFKSSRGALTDQPSIQHGTGHGIGLDLHEPILLDHGGGTILTGEVFTIEPGLYGRIDGGVRIEDMVVATDNGPKNLNTLPESLTWA
jgi:Xaa-Pro aminopeptidase